MPDIRIRKPPNREALRPGLKNELQDHNLSASYDNMSRVWTVWNTKSGCIKAKCADIAEIKIYLSKWQSPSLSSSQTPISV